jgi:hypothetical protein
MIQRGVEPELNRVLVSHFVHLQHVNCLSIFVRMEMVWSFSIISEKKCKSWLSLSWLWMMFVVSAAPCIREIAIRLAPILLRIM